MYYGVLNSIKDTSKVVIIVKIKSFRRRSYMKELEIIQKIEEYLKAQEQKKYEAMKEVDWNTIYKSDNSNKEEIFDF